jgi:hypothetical protein
VPDRAALVDMIRALRRDFAQRGDEWENPTALAAWVSDADGWYARRGEDLPEHGDWAFFARALRAAAYYE